MANSALHYTLTQIASKLGLELQLAPESKNPDTQYVEGVATLSAAGNTDIAFLSNQRYQQQLTDTRALAVILQPAMAKLCQVHCLLAEDPYLSYAKLTQLFAPESANSEGVHGSAIVHPDVKLGERVRIGAGVVIGAGACIGNNTEINANVVIERNVSVGDNTIIRPNATLCHDVRLGNNVTVQSGAVIGGEGFGFAPEIDRSNGQRRWQKIAQLGSVVIGDRVEIGVNTAIDRGALDNTIIESDVIIDNQVQIAHNVVVGEGTAIAGCVGIAGSTKIGKRCSIGGGAGIAGHLTVADDSTIMGMAMINHSVRKAGAYASGTGMQEATSWRKSAVRFTQLEEMNRRLKQAEKKLAELGAKI
jgi:UDP-3-O-[3-hydroxymyristoyl] glucosamine N-acyltransferase